MADSTLKRCPKCGSDDLTVTLAMTSQSSFTFTQITCKHCGHVLSSSSSAQLTPFSADDEGRCDDCGNALAGQPGPIVDRVPIYYGKVKDSSSSTTGTVRTTVTTFEIGGGSAVRICPACARQSTREEGTRRVLIGLGLAVLYIATFVLALNSDTDVLWMILLLPIPGIGWLCLGGALWGLGTGTSRLIAYSRGNYHNGSLETAARKVVQQVRQPEGYTKFWTEKEYKALR